MTTLTNPYSFPETLNLHMIINIESLGEIADLLVAMSEERLRHTVNYLQRLYFNKIFKKKEKEVMSQRKKNLFNDVKEGCSTG